jgi:hypothetical protein
MTIFGQLAEFGVVPVISIYEAKDALPLADALLEGGLPVAEITFGLSLLALMQNPSVEHIVARVYLQSYSGCVGGVKNGAGVRILFSCETRFPASTDNFRNFCHSGSAAITARFAARSAASL